ncbi:hypothetical protein [Sorangium sp. So ce1151]|uniref:hypothetical protein n=1 Tax=Sorangium sp. So ce1151 TaxID=3133332 RepID=UPI003F5DEAF5
MLSIHGKVVGLAMVMAALGTGCAVDAADVDLDQADLDEAEALDTTSAALEQGADEERGGYQAQAPTKDLFGPSKGMLEPSKGMLGPSKAPVGQLGQAPLGQLGQAPLGQLGQAPLGQLGQAPLGQLGQAPLGQLGQTPSGQEPTGARFFPGGSCGGGFNGGFCGGGFNGFGSCGFGTPFNINNNNNINVITLLEDLFNRNHRPHHHCGSWGDDWP